MPILLHGVCHDVGLDRSRMAPHRIMSFSGHFAILSEIDHDIEEPSTEVLIARAMNHNALLAAYAARGTVLPVRFGTAFTSEDTLLGHLLAHAEEYGHELGRFSGLCEYTVQLTKKRPASEPLLTSSEPMNGSAFLRRRLADRVRRDSIGCQRKAFASRVINHITQLSEQVQPTLQTKPDLILDCSILISRDNVESVILGLNDQAEEASILELEITMRGPLPLYSFVSDTGSGASDVA